MPKNKPPPYNPSDRVQQPLTKRSTVHFDWQEWLPYLEEPEATEAQKRELIETLWSIVLAFVDLGWEVSADVDNSSAKLNLSATLKAAMIELEDMNQGQPQKEKTHEEETV